MRSFGTFGAGVAFGPLRTFGAGIAFRPLRAGVFFDQLVHFVAGVVGRNRSRRHSVDIAGYRIAVHPLLKQRFRRRPRVVAQVEEKTLPGPDRLFDETGGQRVTGEDQRVAVDPEVCAIHHHVFAVERHVAGQPVVFGRIGRPVEFEADFDVGGGGDCGPRVGVQRHPVSVHETAVFDDKFKHDTLLVVGY